MYKALNISYSLCNILTFSTPYFSYNILLFIKLGTLHVTHCLEASTCSTLCFFSTWCFSHVLLAYTDIALFLLYIFIQYISTLNHRLPFLAHNTVLSFNTWHGSFHNIFCALYNSFQLSVHLPKSLH